MNVIQKGFDRLIKIKIGSRVVHEQRYRILLLATCGFFLNLLYACYHGVLGAINHSLWFATMSAYYTLLSTMRFLTVLCGRVGDTTNAKDRAVFIMRWSGALLMALSFVLTGVIYLSLTQNIAVKHGKIVMITIAAYTFYKIALAIARAIKQRRTPSALFAVIRNIGYAEVAASVLTLQRSMLVSFGGMRATDVYIMNLLTGSAVCLFVLVLGIAMLIKGTKGKETIRWQNQSL